MGKPDIGAIVGAAGINGGRYWARTDGNIHAPAGFSTIDVLSTLGDLGVRYGDNDLMAKAVDFMFGYYSPEEGAFRYTPGSARLPCITASILVALGRLGYTDQRVSRCFRALLDSQETDGGWRCKTVKQGKSKATDASNPGTTLYVLEAFSYGKNTKADLAKLERGAQFLLRHWETREPLGPCMFGIGTTFMKTEYPMLRYNILYYCHTLSKYKKAAADRRFQEALEELGTRYRDGSLIIENPHKSWRDFGLVRKGKACEQATRRYREILKRL